MKILKNRILYVLLFLSVILVTLLFKFTSQTSVSNDSASYSYVDSSNDNLKPNEKPLAPIHHGRDTAISSVRADLEKSFQVILNTDVSRLQKYSMLQNAIADYLHKGGDAESIYAYACEKFGEGEFRNVCISAIFRFGSDESKLNKIFGAISKMEERNVAIRGLAIRDINGKNLSGYLTIKIDLNNDEKELFLNQAFTTYIVRVPAGETD